MGATMNEDRYGVVAVSLAPAQLTASTTGEQDFTVPGLKLGDFVAVVKPTLNAGVGIGNARVKAANTLSITFVNATAGTPTPTTETYLVFWFRPEKTPAVVNP